MFKVFIYIVLVYPCLLPINIGNDIKGVNITLVKVNNYINSNKFDVKGKLIHKGNTVSSSIKPSVSVALPQKKKVNKEKLLIKAVRNGNYSRVKELIKIFRLNVNNQDEQGNSLLHTACLSGNQKIVDFLLNHGARWDIRNNQGNTPLHILVIKGYHGIIQDLVWLSPKKIKNAVNIQNNQGNTPLHLAYISSCDFSNFIVEDLLSIKANEFIVNNNGQLPIELESRALHLSYYFNNKNNDCS